MSEELTVKIIGAAFLASTHCRMRGLRPIGVAPPRCYYNTFWLQPVTSLNFGKLHGLKSLASSFILNNCTG